jgi:hypothetical protein
VNTTPHMFLDEPQWFDLKETLLACGRAVVLGITGCVKAGVKPDGSMQKQNAPSTIKAKGHAHPVVEKKHRFEKPKTYNVTAIDENKVMITVTNPENSMIAGYLEDRGYEFFGITPAAEEKAWKILDAYIITKLADTFGGNK